MTQIEQAIEKRKKYYQAVFNCRWYKSGEYFTSIDIATNFSNYGLDANSMGLYLAQLYETGDLQRSTLPGGARVYWRPKRQSEHLPMRTHSNDELGIPDATWGWH